MKLAKQVMGEKLFTKFMKSTFYGHFVAGEDEVQITPVLNRLRQFGVKPILDYSVEEDISQEEAERRELQYVLALLHFLVSMFFLVFILYREKRAKVKYLSRNF